MFNFCFVDNLEWNSFKKQRKLVIMQIQYLEYIILNPKKFQNLWGSSLHDVIYYNCSKSWTPKVFLSFAIWSIIGLISNLYMYLKIKNVDTKTMLLPQGHGFEQNFKGIFALLCDITNIWLCSCCPINISHIFFSFYLVVMQDCIYIKIIN